jgi:hypothetical protein
VTPANDRWIKFGAVFCVFAVMAWLSLRILIFPHRPVAPSPGVVTTRNPAPTPIKPAARVPDEPLPAVGINFDAESSDDELLQLARTVVMRSPQTALAWAQALTDPELRDRVLFAVLRAWGEQDPRAAVNWALNQDESRRVANLEVVLQGAAAQPEVAVEIGRDFLAHDASDENGFSLVLLSALLRTGNFQAALTFANESAPNSRALWLSAVFRHWGENSPEDAAKALNTLEQKESHDAAFQALVTGWAVRNPSGLADYAIKLPPGEERTRALGKALDNWSMQDPASAGEWLNDLPASPELDQAIAGLIARTDRVNRSPEVAMSWVESISDLNLRRDTLIHVMQEWAQAEPAAAWKYFKEITWLNDAQRDEAQKTIQKKIEAANTIPQSED